MIIFEENIFKVDKLKYIVNENLCFVYLYKDKLANGVFCYKNNDIRYFKDGLLHSEVGPAFISNDMICWFLNGIRFYSEVEWFVSLTPEQKYEAIWNLKKP